MQQCRHELKRVGRLRAAKRGFTLIEILVVIAIISLLAGLLFAGFSRARENGRKTNCLSNLRQLQMATMQYVNINDETMPLRFADFEPANNTWEPAKGEKAWTEALQPYIQNTQVFNCPSEGSGATSDPTTNFTDYAYNRALSNLDNNTAGPRTLADISDSEKTIMFLETPPGDPTNSRPETLNHNGLLTGAAALTNTKLARHLSGSNFAFCDGHVKWYAAESDTESSKIYAANTPFKISGDSPTLHASDAVTYP